MIGVPGSSRLQFAGMSWLEMTNRLWNCITEQAPALFPILPSLSFRMSSTISEYLPTSTKKKHWIFYFSKNSILILCNGIFSYGWPRSYVTNRPFRATVYTVSINSAEVLKFDLPGQYDGCCDFCSPYLAAYYSDSSSSKEVLALWNISTQEKLYEVNVPARIAVGNLNEHLVIFLAFFGTDSLRL